jgi:hypothetical protein
MQMGCGVQVNSLLGGEGHEKPRTHRDRRRILELNVEPLVWGDWVEIPGGDPP